jgi:adenosylmethionine-8-amino-7-oxononanoate aminotransferase
VAGVAGDHVLLAPPYIVSEDELDLLVERLAASLDDVLAA